MARYKVKGLLIHNNTEFQNDTVLEMDPKDAAPLIELKALEPTTEEVTQGSKIVPAFSAPASPAQIEKAVNSAALAPEKRGKCPKCKVEREIKNPQISQSEKGIIHMIGECAICGARISRIAGRVKIVKE